MLTNFTVFGRRRAELPELPDELRSMVPTGFEAVAEAIASGADLAAPCAVVGRVSAREGVSLEEALAALQTTFSVLGHETPSFAATEALALAWSDSTLEYLHQISCEDPTTGLASLPHVRTRLADTYREAGRQGVDVRATHALVIVETPAPAGLSPTDRFARMLCQARVAEAMRNVFSGGETIGKLGSDRVVALVARETDLGVSVALLRDMLLALDLPCGDPRIWIEGLPGSSESATRLLDELAR